MSPLGAGGGGGSRALVALALALAAAGCGRYGPPVRTSELARPASAPAGAEAAEPTGAPGTRTQEPEGAQTEPTKPDREEGSGR